MGYIEKNLVPGETVLYKTRLHWIVLIWPLIGGVVLGGIGVVFVVGGYRGQWEGQFVPWDDNRWTIANARNGHSGRPWPNPKEFH